MKIMRAEKMSRYKIFGRLFVFINWPEYLNKRKEMELVKDENNGRKTLIHTARTTRISGNDFIKNKLLWRDVYGNSKQV